LTDLRPLAKSASLAAWSRRLHPSCVEVICDRRSLR
jgi:hypothetical protein